MANSVTHAALPYPVKNARFTLFIPYLDADGDPTDPATPDTEFSGDAGAFADCAEEVTTITGANGTGYITLTGAETNYSMVALAAKVASGPKATLATLYPRVLATLESGTAQAGAAGSLTLAAGAPAYDITGCIIRTTGGTGGGGTGGASNQARVITAYNTSTKVATVVPNWETTPDGTTTYDVLLPSGTPSAVFKTLQPTTLGRTLDVSAGGEAGVDWANVGTPGSTVALSATTVGTATAVTNRVTANVDQFGGVAITSSGGRPEVNTSHVSGTLQTAGDIIGDTNDIQARLPAALVGGRMDANMQAAASGVIARATFAADTGLQSSRSNTAQAGAAGTITLDASASAVTDFYVGMWIVLTGGTGVGQARLCTAYNGTTKVATIAPNWATNPDATSTFAVMTAAQITGVQGNVTGSVASVTGAVGSVTGNVGGNVVGSTGSVTAAVTVGTNNDKTGYGLSAAAVQAIWDALTSALTTVGSIGKLLVDNINATISSRLASASYTAPPSAIDNADALLDRNMGTGTDSGSATVRTVRQALRALRNRVAIAGGTATVYKENDTTASWTSTITTTAGNPISESNPADA